MNPESKKHPHFIKHLPHLKKQRNFLLLLFFILNIPIFVLIIVTLFYISILDASEMTYKEVTFQSHDVDMICEVLNMVEDSFCTAFTPQTIGTFREALYRAYPIGAVTYSDFIPLLNNFSSRPYGLCDGDSINLRIYLRNNCPQPSECHNDYSCVFQLFGTLPGLQVWIEQRTGYISSFVLIGEQYVREE